MRQEAGRAKVSWLVWASVVAAVLVLGVGALAWWAFENDSAATLDALDARFSRKRAALLLQRARYGRAPAQKLALYVPAGTAPTRGFPLVVFFHGGGWHEGDPYDYGWIARSLAERGYAVALVGYRLNRDGRFPNMLLDSAAGTRKALDEAGKHRIDTKRIALMGHSAGAYNAAMLTLDPRWLVGAGVPGALLKGAVILAGPSDFYPFDKKSSINAMGHWPRPAETQPINFARADAPPLLLVHGTADTIVRPRNATILAAALTARGAPTRATLIRGMGHIGLVVTLAKPFDRDRRVGEAVFAFLARVLPAGNSGDRRSAQNETRPLTP